MKKLTMWLGCALTAFAIGCGDESPKSSPPKMPDPKTTLPGPTTKMDTNATADPAAGGTATEKPADAEKKDGDTEKPADPEKKEGDAEKKEGDAEEKK